MRYWRPFTEDAVKDIKEDGCVRPVAPPFAAWWSHCGWHHTHWVLTPAPPVPPSLFAVLRITRLVVLPLYPQFSISTSGSSLRLLEQVCCCPG